MLCSSIVPKETRLLLPRPCLTRHIGCFLKNTPCEQVKCHTLGLFRVSASSLGRFQGDKDNFVIGLAVDGETRRIGTGTGEDELTDRERFPIPSAVTAWLGAEAIVEGRVL